MKKTFDFVVQVVYDGTMRIEAESLPEAENRARQLARPQSVVCDGMMGENEDFSFDPHPTVHFLHHSEIPVREDGE